MIVLQMSEGRVHWGASPINLSTPRVHPLYTDHGYPHSVAPLLLVAA
ncbi:hypothetical protein KNU98_gp093 [Agrobacterium phage OLIVR1]|uniref:Uncharacterized protein n=1 Tax=Agrobacterium phage OLIVR1 TaxID=2723769 RepID=A0A858MSD3_9CAUD|nr:hypothetical protein KNU98_gp093 [Agrobacterium phage OLIVR1]QIW87211.1 hypothetical protein Ab1vBOLIVR1_gp16 [Agrobacterium phage OLIVR1]